MRSPNLFAIIVMAASLGACTALPQRLRGDFAELEPNQTSTGEVNGYPVRWGGIVTGERVADRGACIEVAVFPLDKWTQRPIGLIGTKAYHHVAMTRPAYFISGKLRPAPRFLACGDQILDGTTFYPGAVVTTTGIVEPSYVFETDPARCWGEPMRAADYASTPYVAEGARCVVSMPVLKISQVYAWIDPPKVFPGFSSYP